jgi:PAS domain S-box-containing protein
MQIEAAEQLFQSLATHAPVGLFHTDARGNCIFVNNRWCEIAGLTPEQAIRAGWAQALHPDDRERVLREWNQAAETAQEFGSEYRFRTPEGVTTWLRGAAAPLYDADGQVVGYIGSITDITERRLADEALGAKEAQLRLITDHVPILIANCSADLRFKFVNQGYAARLGLAPERIVGRSIVEVLGAEAYQSFAKYVECVLAGRRVQFEVTVPYRDLGERVMQCSYVPEHDALGKVVGWVAAIADVTERRHAEQALLDSDRRFTQFMRHLPGLAWIKDPQGRYVFANDAALEAFNTTREGLYGRTDEQVFPEATARQFRDNDTQVLASAAKVAQTIETLEHPDGQIHHSLVSKFAIPGPDDGPPMIGGIAVDITERLHIEDQLRRNQQRLELAQAAGRIGTFEWHIESNEVEWSSTEEELFGLTQGSFGGRLSNWEELVHPDDRAEAVSACVRAVNERSDLNTEFRIIRPDGQVRWIAARAKVYCDEQGRPQRMIGVNVDTTERRNVETSLREADRLKDEFLATLAHELRNPLAPLQNSLHLVSLATGDKVLLDQAAETMKRQVSQMVHLIDDLLDVSRISRNKLVLRSEPIDLRAAIRNAVESTQPLLQGMNHQLMISVPETAVTVFGDLTRLSQVFANLLSNAAKYTYRAGRIGVQLERDETHAVVTVRDNGIGIPPNRLHEIFEMFVQIDKSLERTQGGLGIGLTLVRRLVELHGGSVEAHSDGSGTGSQFVVRLPLLQVAPPSSDGRARPNTARRITGRILVVDDNVDSATSLARLLALLGADVRTAHDGLDGVHVAEAFLPDVVLMDLGMPRLNGFDAARRIRTQPWSKNCLLVAVTGWGQDVDRQRSRDAGFDVHLAKPLELGVLEKLIRERFPQPAE